MTCATATTNPCIAHCNLSATADHYGTHDNLCSTITDPLGTRGSLSTATDPLSMRFGNHKDLRNL